jgi:cysteine desulfurase family protein
MMPRIYFDNAATSWPKPESVYAAVDHYQREIGAPAGRGSYQAALAAGQLVEQARAGVARLIGASKPHQIVFTSSGTDALNLAIHGILSPGDHVVTTVCEHNSVLRPLQAWAENRNVNVTYVSCDNQGRVSAADVQAALQPKTKLVAVLHGSNVTGAVQPIEEIGQAVRSHPATFLVDAAQTLGHLPLDVQSLQIDLLAAPAHKGLLGPLGTGFLYIHPTVQQQLQPLRQGGTGSSSHQDRQPETLPDKFEAGNLNVPGLAGVAAACDFLQQRSIEHIKAETERLTTELLNGLGQLKPIRIYGPPAGTSRLGVVSFSVRGYDPQDISTLLDASFGIACRAGLHCASRLHRTLGTDEIGGTVRLSLGFANTQAEVESVLEAMATICVTSATEG